MRKRRHRKPLKIPGVQARELEALALVHQALRTAMTTADKITVLRHASRWGHGINPKLLRERRTLWNRYRNRLEDKTGRCVCCRVATTHHHHIHGLWRGGHPTASENRVWICFDCHGGVHDWMVDPDAEADEAARYDAEAPVWAKG